MHQIKSCLTISKRFGEYFYAALPNSISLSFPLISVIYPFLSYFQIPANISWSFGSKWNKISDLAPLIVHPYHTLSHFTIYSKFNKALFMATISHPLPTEDDFAINSLTSPTFSLRSTWSSHSRAKKTPLLSIFSIRFCLNLDKSNFWLKSSSVTFQP